MPNLFIDTSIEVAAPVEKVWETLRAAHTSDWEVGSAISCSGMDGKIMKIENQRLLKHNVLEPVDGIQTLSSIITYEMEWMGEKTLLKARESFAEAQEAAAFKKAGEALKAKLVELKTAAES